GGGGGGATWGEGTGGEAWRERARGAERNPQPLLLRALPCAIAERCAEERGGGPARHVLRLALGETAQVAQDDERLDAHAHRDRGHQPLVAPLPERLSHGRERELDPLDASIAALGCRAIAGIRRGRRADGESDHRSQPNSPLDGFL